MLHILSTIQRFQSEVIVSVSWPELGDIGLPRRTLHCAGQLAQVGTTSNSNSTHGTKHSCLVVLAQSRPLLWRELAKSVPGRSNKDCRRRWWNTLAAGTAKGPWSEEEDARLTEAIWKYGFTWTHVAQAVMTRNADQCSSHWSQVLDPSINHCDWTPTEDAQLLQAVLAHGTNWATIAASHLPKRTTLALKNRYSTLGLLNQNNSKKFKEQTDKKSTPSSLDTNPVMESRRAAKIVSRKRSDVPGFGNEKTAVEGEEEEEDGEDEEDEDDSTESGYSANEDEDNSAMSLDQIIAPSNNQAHRRDTMNSTESSGIWNQYFDRSSGGLVLQPAALQYNNRMTALPTPLSTPLHTPTSTGTWKPEVADPKNMFMSSTQLSQPSFEAIGDYSSFVGTIHDSMANMPGPSYRESRHPSPIPKGLSLISYSRNQADANVVQKSTPTPSIWAPPPNPIPPRQAASAPSPRHRSRATSPPRRPQQRRRALFRPQAPIRAPFAASRDRRITRPSRTRSRWTWCAQGRRSRRW